MQILAYYGYTMLNEALWSVKTSHMTCNFLIGRVYYFNVALLCMLKFVYNIDSSMSVEVPIKLKLATLKKALLSCKDREWVRVLWLLKVCICQYDQMSTLSVQHLSIYNNENLPNSKNMISKLVNKYCLILIKSSRNDQTFWHLAKLAKFSPIRSHLNWPFALALKGTSNMSGYFTYCRFWHGKKDFKKGNFSMLKYFKFITDNSARPINF